MAEPKAMIVPMLREMRKDIDDGFRNVREEMNTRFDKVDERLEKLERGQKSLKNAMTADTMMAKFMLGDDEERLQSLEDKVAALAKGR